MRSRNTKTSLLILVIFLMQIIAPTISADGPNQPSIVVQNNEHYSLMEEIGVMPMVNLQTVGLNQSWLLAKLICYTGKHLSLQ